MIFDVTESESDETVNGLVIHCVWIRHERRDQTGNTPLHYTLAAAANGRFQSTNFKANCPDCRKSALLQVAEMLRS